MQRKNRLTQSSDIQRVRLFGKSYAHPLVILIKEPTGDQRIRIGIIAGKSIGDAVERNHAKRWLRAAVQSIMPQIEPGYNLIFIARKPITTSEFRQVLKAVDQLAERADILVR